MNAAGDQFCANCGYFLAGPPPNAPTIMSIPTPPGPNNPPTQTSTQTATSGPNAPTVAAMAGSGGRRYTGALQAQTLLEGRYRIVRLVGKGGFGAVYEAKDERFQARMVAIKEMGDAQLSPSEKAQAIQNFRQEANLLVPLQHPNLPNVSDFFEEAGKAYLAMEFVQGKTLEDVQRAANAPPGRATCDELGCATL
jgi:hypothetical protein